jgi:hypothetical protein
MEYHQREAVGAGAKKSDIAERQIAGEPVDHVDALSERHEDDEVEKQKVIAVDAREDREDDDDRQQNQQKVAH